MNVVLNPDLETLVKQKVTSGEFPNAEAVLEEGLRLLKARDRTQARIENLLVEAEESGPAIEMTAREWDEIRREVREAHEKLGAR
ncbi:MAG TPA: type II toxin-antitoxin system ParD family antitoxin [Terriglobia bacterium]|nr:type II toxin-antitoxin system ParD family antitoxin [Terriglobia bacterium]